MKKNILSLIFFAVALLMAGLAYADQYAPGAGYDPTSPADPSERYRLETEAVPVNGGSTYNYDDSSIVPGSNVYVGCSNNNGYIFDGWYEGDELISTSPYFYYKMPAHSVKLIAKFALTNPDDPMRDGYTHRVKVTYDPKDGGSISNGDYFMMREGWTYNLYAYPNSGYKLNAWRINGVTVEPDQNGNPVNPLRLTMGDKDIDLTVKFAYVPDSPGDPLPNSFNEATGELIVDNFQSGNLQGTINNLIDSGRFHDKDRSDVHSVIIAGRMDYWDRDFGYGMINCALVDLSRTSGFTYLDYNPIYEMEALTDLILPKDLADAHSYSFAFNPNLANITCYAGVPPYVDSYYDEYDNLVDWFQGIGFDGEKYMNDITLRVPASSLSLYKDAAGWKYFNITTIEDGNCSWLVTLPENHADGRYNGMSLVLESPTSGQKETKILNNHSASYRFDNLIMSREGMNFYYNVSLRTQNDEELGGIYNITLTQSGERVDTLKKVKSLNDLNLKVLQSDGKDVANELQIVWKNPQGEYIGSGSKVSGIIEGKEVSAIVTLPDSYGVQYIIPEPVKFLAGENNDATLQLETYPVEIIKEGKMTDEFDGKPIAGGSVTIEQTLAGKYRHSSTQITDKDGVYHNLSYVKHPDAKGKVTARATSYMNQPSEIENFVEWEVMQNFAMKPITGAKLNVELLWKAPGQETTSYTDFSNIDFALTNITANKEIQNFSNQAPLLVIPDEASANEEIKVTVISRNGHFEEAFGIVKLDNERVGTVNIEILEHGKIASTISGTEASGASAILYDENGRMIKHVLYDAKNSVSFNNLKEGKYTLVAMADSPYFTGFANISELIAYDVFNEGSDYLLEEVKVNDGDLTEVKFGNVPNFDASGFYFTDPTQTLLKVNKTSVTASNYVTLSTKFNFKSEYISGVSNVNLVYQFPEHCQYVEGSLMNGAKVTDLIKRGNDYIAENVTPGSTVRFCLMPEKGDDYYPTVALEYDYNGTPMTQPLGSFFFQGVDFQIFVPKKTSRESVWARGVATASSDVTVFIQGVPGSSAKAAGNGDWLAEVKLINPEPGKLQQLYGEISSATKGTFPTESAVVEYDPEYPELEYVRMVHNGYAVDFEHPKVKTNAKSYSYNPDRDMFTMQAKFDETANGGNVESVNFHILNSDGSERVIDAVYSNSQRSWVATLGFPDSFRLPVNVTVEFTYKKGNGSSSFNLGYIAPDVQPIIDPSGFVYEAKEDNRVENATVTVFYQEESEDNYGAIIYQTVKWNAAEYDQENPLLTDKEGLYGWDVPAGKWQVKYEKKGYRTEYSEWLQVPPPQLEVNQNLIREDAPYVKEVHAYSGSNGVEILFSHFMKFDSLTDNIYLLRKSAVEGEDDIKLEGQLKKEMTGNNEDDENIATVRFIPNEPLPNTVENVNLFISPKVLSYANKEMGGTGYNEPIYIEPEITSVALDDDEIEIEEGETLKLVISAVPAQAAVGKTLRVTNKSEYIINFHDVDNSLEFDEENNLVLILDDKGQAEVTIEGLMAGQSQLDLTVDGSTVTGRGYIDVKTEVINLAKPTASLPHKSIVYRGVLAELSSRYADGVIYYTLDGTDPTPLTGIKYTEAIKVDNKMTIKAIVVVNGKVSEIAEFAYTLVNGLQEIPLNQGWSWISHNMESPVSVDKFVNDNVTRILSQTAEVIRDEKYGMVGTLTELAPQSSYKIQSKNAASVPLNDVAYNPNTPISLKKGWNWIGYPVGQKMDLDEAFAEGSCENGDKIETLSGGFAEYKDGRWIGDLVQHGMKPSLGYLYYAVSAKDVQYNTSLVSQAAARLALQPRTAGAPWATDKYLYPSIMPIVADVIKADGTIAEEGEYQVAAFCGSECRGVGIYMDGYLFITVHGNQGDQISFRMLENAENAQEFMLQQTLRFTEDPVGSLDDPFELLTAMTDVNSIKYDSNLNVSVKNRRLYVEGNDVDYVAVYDINGNKILATNHADSPISLDIVNVGVHIIAVRNAGEWSYRKLMIK